MPDRQPTFEEDTMRPRARDRRSCRNPLTPVPTCPTTCAPGGPKLRTKILAAWLGLLIAAAWAGGAEPGANLVANPSFDEASNDASFPDAWSGARAVYGLDRDVARTGRASLKYANDDAGRYVLCSQPVELRPGRKYRFSAWVKTREIAGPESGATLCIEWRGADGNWLGGSYPSGVKGTRDWTRVVGVTRVPDEATSFTLACYVRKGMTGTAWFDDVEVVQIVDPPMRTVLRSPVYRGRIAAGGPKLGQVRVRLDLVDYDHRPSDLRIRASLHTPAEAKARWQTEVRPGSDAAEPIDLSFPTSDLAAGRYELNVELLAPDGSELQRAAHELVRVPDDFRPRCTIDEHRRLLVDGEPFFPIGMYWSSIHEEDLKLYARSKFNCLMPYGSPTREQMDLAERLGLKVIYSIKDWYAGSRYCPPSIKTVDDEEPMVRARVGAFRDHPALLAWYLNDELPQHFMPQLDAHQRWVAEEDPDHPTWVVLYQYREVSAYLNTFDVIGTDPYPIGRAPASWAAEWTAETFRQVEGARPLWQVPQLHNWANYRKDDSDAGKYRTPTFDEKRSMAWQCICEGATGLVFYSWYDVKRNPDVSFDEQWEGLKRIAAEIDRLAPVLLSVEPVPEVRTLCGSDTRPAWLRCLVRRHGGKLYVIAANDGDGEGQVTFALPAVPHRIRELSDDRPIDVEGPSFADELGRLAVKIYEIVPVTP